jgi:predicted CXXCH cytochrome family protein
MTIMRILKSVSWALAGLICLSGASGIWQSEAKAAEIVDMHKSGAAKLDNASCQTCHNDKNKKIMVSGSDGKMRPLHFIAEDKYAQSVHAKMLCIDCHKEISNSAAPHKLDLSKMVGCVQCHEDLWEAAKKNKQTQEKPRLGVVVQNIESYQKSFHARQNEDDPTKANATCKDCHDTHSFNVPPKGSPGREAWRLTIPNTCGATCHTDELDDYKASAHGKEVMGKHNPKGAVCTDCHTTHDITNTSLHSFKMDITQVCGGCHEENLKSYTDTYHGQVNALGYSYTANCYNCHGSHGILGPDDPKSKVFPANRLKTCRQCHNGKKMPEATAGFITFGPHANSHDFKKYPQVWIATKFMQALLLGVFIFFWLHSGLWYFREWQDRKQRKSVKHVRTDGLPLEDGKKFFQRFPVGWRIAHLVFALVTMTLVLTGTTALFSNTSWAPVVAHAFGGPSNLGLIHRVAAALFISIFFIHFVYVMQKLLRDRSFRWFGSDSLIPNWKDLADCWGMFKWFVGKGEKPRFDRWTYFEKFDYWAVFWGVTIIGTSGLMLAFPNVTASFLPGWVFNVATIVHGEEAFLAAVFLFTVHFFNNHFRPDKLPPPDIVMFTGTQSLEEFRRDHPAQYQRLVDTGELDKYLVDGPSRPMALGSKILGLALITIGLVLLTLVIIGFLSGGAK